MLKKSQINEYSDCMHVLHSGGLRFGGGTLMFWTPISVNLKFSLFKVTFQLLCVMVSWCIYRMHTFVASNCMHVVHSGGFRFSGSTFILWTPISVNLKFSLFMVTFQLLCVMVQLLIAMALPKPLGVKNCVDYPN